MMCCACRTSTKPGIATVEAFYETQSGRGGEMNCDMAVVHVFEQEMM